MLNKPLFLISLLVAASVALAQGGAESVPVIGTASKVEGLVTVSDGRTIANLLVGNKLVDGSHIVTSSTGRVTVRVDDGCDVHLEPNQSLTLRGQMSCEALALSIQTLPGNFNPIMAAALLASAALLRGAGGGGSPNPPLSGQ